MHNHSRYSVNDALPMVPEMAVEAAAKGWPALGLTDHGSPAGLVQLYRSCRKEGLEPLPGCEIYVTPDHLDKVQGHNLHLTVNAYTEQGYRNLCRLVTLSARNFYYKPRVDLADLAAMAEQDATRGLMVSTGCWFGLVPTIMRESGPDAALQMTKTLARWFPRVYVELQNHGIEEQRPDTQWIVGEEQWGEEEMVKLLVWVAEQAGLRYIVTTDSHYIRPEDRRLHNGLKELTSWSDSPDDAVFPGDPYCFQDTDGMRRYFEPQVLDRALEALSSLVDVASVRIPELDTFRALVPDVTGGGDPVAELRRRCMEAFERHCWMWSSAREREKRLQRLTHELDVTEQTGLSDFELLFADLCRWMTEQEIVFNARGSANDSFMNYLLNITNVDAFARPGGGELRFERYISIDRRTPPDVDFDIDHERRDEVVAEMSRRFTTCQVGTIMKYSLSAEEGEEDEHGRGSLRVRYFHIMGKQGKRIERWADAPKAHRDMLWKLSDLRLISGYGTHPSGLILAPDPAAIADLPMARVGSGERVHYITAYDKNDVEDFGFIKGDFLGLRTLTAVRVACQLIEPGTAPMAFLRSIPLDDKATYRRISDGNTEGCFQLSKPSATRFMERMKPRNINDMVAAMALIRPAAGGESNIRGEYLSRRKGTTKADPMHPDLEAETRETYGLLLFQEQVIGCLRTLRMEMPELNKLLKAVKASNEYVVGAKLAIAEALPRIRDLAEKRGWSESDVEILVDAISGYADYGFNEGHATAYGLFAYRTSWLAEHYPLEWWTGVLTAYAGEDDEPIHVRSARKYGVRILAPHVNKSRVTYSCDQQHRVIRKGLMSVKGIAEVAAEELVAHAPYRSLVDLGQRVTPRRVSGAKQLAMKTPPEDCGGKIAALFDVGALDGLEMEVTDEKDSDSVPA